MSTMAGERSAARLVLAVFLVCLLVHWFCVRETGASGICLVVSLYLLLVSPGLIPALRLGRKLSLEPLEVIPLAVCLSLGQAALILLAFSWLELPVLASRWVLMFSTLIWWIWAEFGGRAGSAFDPDCRAPATDLSRRWRFLVALSLIAAVIAVSIVLLRIGAPLQWETDSVAHVAAIRGVVEEERVFPVSQPYGPNGIERPDPRFGVFHAVCALLVVSSGVEIHTLWGLLPGFLGPLLMLALFSAARAITGNTKTALVTSLFFPVFYGGIQHWGLLTVGYPNRVSMLMYFIYLGLFFTYLRSGRKWLLFPVAFLTFSAAAIHVYHFIEFVFVMVCLLLVELATARGRWSQLSARLTGGLAVAAGVTLPFLAYRFFTSYSTANLYNVGVHGSLYLNGDIYILNPLEAYGWIGVAGVVSVLLLPYFVLRAARKLSHAFVTAATAGPLLLVFNPVLLPVASAALSYLAARLVWAIPYVLSLGIFVTEFPGSIKSVTNRGRVFLVLGMLLVAWTFAGALVHRVDSLRVHVAQGERDFPDDLAAISGVIGRLDTEIDGRRVFLSDPVTAYAIPAFTRHFVTAIPVAHSAPADSFPVERVRDAVDALNPDIGLAETVHILKKYHVDFVVVNTGFEKKLSAFEYEIRPEIQERTLAKISSNPIFFEKVFSEGELHVFRVKNLDLALQAEQEETEFSDGVEQPGAEESIFEFSNLVSLESVEMVPTAVRRGDSLRINSRWRCIAPLPRGDVHRLFVRLETEFPKGALYWKGIEKPYRKLLERRTGRKFRFRHDVDPHSFVRPLHLWRKGEIVRESFIVVLPEDLASGKYRVEMSLKRISGGIKFRLSDYLVDRDFYSGVEVGTIEVL